MNRRYIEAVVPKKLKNFIRAHRKTVAPRNFFDVYILGKHLAYIIKDRSIDLVIDVGANVGQFGSMVRERSKYKGAIISFEPQPEMYGTVVKRSKGDKNWRAYNFAIGKEETILTLNIMRSHVFSSFLKPKEGLLSDLNAVVSTIEVPVKRLDEVIKSLDIPYKNILLKTDTQGFDLDVLMGAEGIINNTEAIVCEISILPIYENSPRYEHMLKLQNKLGYTLSGLYPVSLSRGQAIECDCIMVKKKTAPPDDHIPYIEIFTR